MASEVVNFTFEVSGSSIILSTEDGSALKDNSVYDIVIEDIVDSDGASSTPFRASVVTALTPYYSSVDEVELVLGSGDYANDYKIALQIRDASKRADYVMRNSTLDPESYAVQRYVAVRAAYNIALGAYASRAGSSSGMRGQLGEISFEYTKSDDMKNMIGKLKDEVDYWEAAMLGYDLSTKAKPLSTVKSSKSTTAGTFTTFTGDTARQPW